MEQIFYMNIYIHITGSDTIRKISNLLFKLNAKSTLFLFLHKFINN